MQIERIYLKLKNRFYGIAKSLEKIEFARDFLKGRDVRGSFEKKEYFSQKNVIVRDKNRKDRGIRQAFRKNGYAPQMMSYPGEALNKPKQLIKKR